MTPSLSFRKTPESPTIIFVVLLRRASFRVVVRAISRTYYYYSRLAATSVPQSVANRRSLRQRRCIMAIISRTAGDDDIDSDDDYSRGLTSESKQAC